MNHKKLLLGLLLASLIGWGGGYVLSHATQFGLCLQSEYSCRDIYNHIGDPLYYSMGALTVVFLVLLIFPAAYHAWKWFALWYVPFAAEIFIFYQGPSGGFLDPTPYPEQVYRWTATIYIVISLIIIGVSIARQKLGKTKSSGPWSQRKKIIFWTAWVVYVGALFLPHAYSFLWNLTG